MVESDIGHAKKSVLVLGTLGIGKSTFLNTLGATFETSNQPVGCTLDIKRDDTIPGYALIDSPGLNDMDMTLAEWAQKLNTSGLNGQPLDLCLLVFKQTPRPQVTDKQNVIVMQEAVTAIQASNIAVVFTHCD